MASVLPALPQSIRRYPVVGKGKAQADVVKAVLRWAVVVVLSIHLVDALVPLSDDPRGVWGACAGRRGGKRGGGGGSQGKRW